MATSSPLTAAEKTLFRSMLIPDNLISSGEETGFNQINEKEITLLREEEKEIKGFNKGTDISPLKAAIVCTAIAVPFFALQAYQQYEGRQLSSVFHMVAFGAMILIGSFFSSNFNESDYQTDRLKEASLNEIKDRRIFRLIEKMALISNSSSIKKQDDIINFLNLQYTRLIPPGFIWKDQDS